METSPSPSVETAAPATPARRVRIVEPPSSARRAASSKPMRTKKSAIAHHSRPSAGPRCKANSEEEEDDITALWALHSMGTLTPSVMDTPDTEDAFLQAPLHPATALIDENALFETIERAVHHTLRAGREDMISTARDPARRYHDAKAMDVWDTPQCTTRDVVDAQLFCVSGAASPTEVFPEAALVTAVPEVREAAVLVRELKAMKSSSPSSPHAYAYGSDNKSADTVDMNDEEGGREGGWPLTSSPSSPDTLVDILDAIDRRTASAPDASLRGGSRFNESPSAAHADPATSLSPSHKRGRTLDPELFDPAQYAMALLRDAPRSGPSRRRGDRAVSNQRGEDVHDRGAARDGDACESDEDEEDEAMERALIAEYFPELALSEDVTDPQALNTSLKAALRALRDPDDASIGRRPSVLTRQHPHVSTNVLETGDDPEEIRRLLHYSLSALQQRGPASSPATATRSTPSADPMPSQPSDATERPAAQSTSESRAASATPSLQRHLRRANKELVQHILAALPPIPEDMKTELARQRRLLEHLTEVQQDHLRRLARQQQDESRRRVQAPRSSPTLDLFRPSAASTAPAAASFVTAADIETQRRLGLDKVVEPFVIGRQLQRAASDAKQPLPPLVTITTAPKHISPEDLAEREAKFYEREMYRLRDDYAAMLERERQQRTSEQRAFREALARQQTTMTNAHKEALNAVQREARLQQRENASLAYQLTAAQEVVHRADMREMHAIHDKKTQKMLKGTVEVLQSYAKAATHNGEPDDGSSRRRQSEVGPAPDLSRPRYEDATGHRRWPRPRTRSVTTRATAATTTDRPAASHARHRLDANRTDAAVTSNQEDESGEAVPEDALVERADGGSRAGGDSHSADDGAQAAEQAPGGDRRDAPAVVDDEERQSPPPPRVSVIADDDSDIAVIPVAPTRQQTKRPSATRSTSAGVAPSAIDVAAAMPQKKEVKALTRGTVVKPYTVHLPDDVRPTHSTQQSRTAAAGTTTRHGSAGRITAPRRTSAGAVIHRTPLSGETKMAAPTRTARDVKTAAAHGPRHDDRERNVRRTPSAKRRVSSSLVNSPYHPSTRTPSRRVSAVAPRGASSVARRSSSLQPGRGRGTGTSSARKRRDTDHSRVSADPHRVDLPSGDEVSAADEEAALEGETSTAAAVPSPRFCHEEFVTLTEADGGHHAHGALRAPTATDLAAAQVGRPLWLLMPPTPLEADQVAAELARHGALSPYVAATAISAEQSAQARHQYAAQQRVEHAYALPKRFLELSSGQQHQHEASTPACDVAQPPPADVFFFGSQMPSYTRKWTRLAKAEQEVEHLARKVRLELATQDRANLCDHQRRLQGVPIQAADQIGYVDTAPSTLSRVRVRAEADRVGVISSETDKERAAAAAALAADSVDADAQRTPTSQPDEHTPLTGFRSEAALVVEAKALRAARQRLAHLRASLLTPCCTGVWSTAAEAMRREAAQDNVDSDGTQAQRVEALRQQMTSEVIHSLIGEQRETALFARVMKSLEADLLSLMLQQEASRAFTAVSPGASSAAAVVDTGRVDDSDAAATAAAPPPQAKPLSEKEKDDEATLLYFLEEAILRELEASTPQRQGTDAAATETTRHRGDGVGKVKDAALWTALEAALARIMQSSSSTSVMPAAGRPHGGIPADKVVHEVVCVPQPTHATSDVVSTPLAHASSASSVPMRSEEGMTQEVRAAPSESTAVAPVVQRFVGPLRASQVVGHFTPSATLPHASVTSPAVSTSTTTGGAVPLVIRLDSSSTRADGGEISAGQTLRLVLDVAPLFRALLPSPQPPQRRQEAQPLSEEPRRAADATPDEYLGDVEVERTVSIRAVQPSSAAVVPPVPQVPPLSVPPTAPVPSSGAPPPLVVSDASALSAAASPATTTATHTATTAARVASSWSDTFLREALVVQERVQREYVEDHEETARTAMTLLWDWHPERQAQREELREARKRHAAMEGRMTESEPVPAAVSAAAASPSHDTTHHSDVDIDDPTDAGGDRSRPLLPSMGGAHPHSLTSTSTTSSASTSARDAQSREETHHNEGKGRSVKDPITRFVLEWLDQYGTDARNVRRRDEVVDGLHAAAANASASQETMREPAVPTRTSLLPSSSSLSAPGSSWLSSTSTSSFCGNGGHVFVRDARMGADRFVAAKGRRQRSRRRRAPGAAYTPSSAREGEATITTTSASSNATTRYTRPSRETHRAPRPILDVSSAPLHQPPSWLPPAPQVRIRSGAASTLVPADATFLKTNYTSSTSRATYREGSGSSFASSSEERGAYAQRGGADGSAGHGTAFSASPAPLYRSSVLSGINDSCVGEYSAYQDTSKTESRVRGAVALQISREALREEVLRLQAHQRQREADGIATLGFEGPYLRQLSTQPVTAPPG